jgi:hypothetical protein
MRIERTSGDGFFDGSTIVDGFEQLTRYRRAAAERHQA